MATRSSVHIELARAADCIELADLSRVAIEYGLKWRWKPSRILELIRSPNCSVIMAKTSAGKIAGFAAMEFQELHGHLSLLATRSEYRRQGIGRQLLDWLEGSARIAGLSYIGLEVRQGNAGAIRFYELAGYETQVVKHGYYEGKENALRMSHQLISAEFAAKRP